MTDIENKTLDEKRLNSMKVNILRLEQENLKTRDKTTEEMVEAIRKIISDEIKKNYWGGGNNVIKISIYEKFSPI